MKPYLIITLLAAIAVTSCAKYAPDLVSKGLRPLGTSNPAGQATDSAVLPSFPIQSANYYAAGGSQPAGCSVLPLYGDTLVFPQPATGDDIIQPVNSPGPGKYFAWPAGMVLDQHSGAVNLTQSQAGMRYAIGFVPNGTTDTCISTLIIGGAAYYDSVYVLGDGDTLALPYFNANAGLANICSVPGACTFDYNGQAAARGVIVDPATGMIQLSKTTGKGAGQLKGLFGAVPHNGATAVVNIAYKLNDGSNNAPQQIAVQFEYYDTKSQVAPGQLKMMEANTLNAMQDALISTSRNARPPIIIITRKN
jgi:hypothetical protein